MNMKLVKKTTNMKFVKDLYSRLTALAQQTGLDVRNIETAQGDLKVLATTDKSSLVSAINEINSRVSSINSSITDSVAGLINDGVTAGTSTWSSQQIASNTAAAVAQAKSDILGGLPQSTLDTLNKLAAQLAGDESVVSAIAADLATKLDFNSEQVLTSVQKSQALANIGGASTADLGSLAAQVMALSSSVSTAQAVSEEANASQFNAINSALATMQSQLAGAVTGLTQLQSIAATQSKDIADLQAALEATNQQVASNQTELSNALATQATQTASDISSAIYASETSIYADLGQETDLLAVYLAAKSGDLSPVEGYMNGVNPGFTAGNGSSGGIA